MLVKWQRKLVFFSSLANPKQPIDLHLGPPSRERQLKRWNGSHMRWLQTGWCGFNLLVVNYSPVTVHL